MQRGNDLVGAGYPTGFPLRGLLGGLSNYSQPNIPARSNIEWFGFNTTDTASWGCASTTGTIGVAAVPVDVGTPITRVTVLIGATAASVPTHAFAAIYAGTGSAPALLAQSTDTTSVAIAASGSFTFTLASTVTPTEANAPNGFVYVGVSSTATTQPSAASIPVGATTFATHPFQTNGPILLGAIFGSAVAGTAPTTITSTTLETTAPVVLLT